MKISLEEARKRATPGKLRVTALAVGDTDLVADNLEYVADCTDTPNCKNNAALLAHKCNHFDEGVAALELIAKATDLHSARVIAETVLARAKAVEMP